MLATVQSAEGVSGTDPFVDSGRGQTRKLITGIG